MKKLEINKYNYIVFAIAVIVLTIGYLVMGTGDYTISPVLLVIAYVVLFPLSIVIGAWMNKKQR